MTNGTQWRSWLDNDQWFNDLPASLQDSLLVGLRLRRFTPGKLIFGKGSPPCGLYALLDGSLRFNDPKQPSQSHTPAMTARPYWFGEVSLFDDHLRQRDVYAEGQVILLHMPQAALTQVLEDQPRHWRRFGHLLGRKLGLGVPAREEMTSLPTDERVAFRLLVLAEGYGALDRSARVIPVADLHSPQCLGLVPEVVDRVLGEFAKRGLLRRDQDVIRDLDIDRLRYTARHRLTTL